MPNLVITHQNSHEIQDVSKILKNLEGWNLFFINTSVSHLGPFPEDIEIHFLLFMQNIVNIYSNSILNIPWRDPKIIKIYYTAYLKNQQIAKIYENGITCCVAGDCRDKHLRDMLQQMWLQHWRRIPDKLRSGNGIIGSARTRKIIQYIENNTLDRFNVADLARYLQLSQGYFRGEFQRLFKMSFRKFKKNLIAYYESILLFKKGLKPVDIYESLNYKNLSAFSRSFKLSHGKCWRDVEQELKKSPLS